MDTVSCVLYTQIRDLVRSLVEYYGYSVHGHFLVRVYVNGIERCFERVIRKFYDFCVSKH